MKRISTAQREQEPVGIVISRGSRAEEPPIVWAYYWEPAPEVPETSVEAPVP